MGCATNKQAEKKMATFDELKSDTTWKEWCEQKIVRRDTLTGAEIVIEPGVAFFVDALEQLGADVQFSCEGHPKGFYVCFAGSHEIALKVVSAGWATVELIRDGRWVLSLKGNENGIESTGRKFDRTERDEILGMMAATWMRKILGKAPNT